MPILGALHHVAARFSRGTVKRCSLTGWLTARPGAGLRVLVGRGRSHRLPRTILPRGPAAGRAGGETPGRARAAGAGEACTGRDGDHVAPDGGRSPARLAAFLTRKLLTGGSRPAQAGDTRCSRAVGRPGRALTPALSQGDRGGGEGRRPHPGPLPGGQGEDGPHPAAPLSRRRGGGREARAGFAGTPGRVATGQGAACCAPTQEGIGEGQSSGGGGAVRWTAKRRRTLARSAPDAAIRREGRRVVHRAGRRSRGWWIRWRTY